MKSSANADALRADAVVWSIGELAERFGLETHVLRHWESEGLLEPEAPGELADAPDDGSRRCA